MSWTDSIKSIKVGIAVEETAGTVETAPQEYIYTTSEAVLNPEMTQDELRAMGSRGITFSVDKPYHVTGNVPSWAFPETNGFGYMLYGAFGSATSASVTGTAVYVHKFSVVDTQVPSFTLWCKTGVYEVKTSNNQVNKLVIKNDKASIMDYSADFVGSELMTATDFGTETYVTGGTKVFRSGGTSVFWDDTLSSNVDDISITIDNGINPDDAKSLGTVYANHILAGDRSITGEATIFVESTTELEDFWGASTGPVLNKAPIPIIIKSESSAIISTATTVGSAVKICGSGTPTITTGGSYTGTAADALFEIKIDSIGPDKLMWRKDGGSWSTATAIVTTAMTLSDGVTVTFSAATGNTLKDRWFIQAGKIPYTLYLYMPSCKITGFQQGATGNRLSAKVSWTAEIDGTTGMGFDAVAFLVNTKATSYATSI